MLCDRFLVIFFSSSEEMKNKWNETPKRQKVSPSLPVWQLYGPMAFYTFYTILFGQINLSGVCKLLLNFKPDFWRSTVLLLRSWLISFNLPKNEEALTVKTGCKINWLAHLQLTQTTSVQMLLEPWQYLPSCLKENSTSKPVDVWINEMLCQSFLKKILSCTK